MGLWLRRERNFLSYKMPSAFFERQLIRNCEKNWFYTVRLSSKLWFGFEEMGKGELAFVILVVSSAFLFWWEIGISKRMSLRQDVRAAMISGIFLSFSMVKLRNLDAIPGVICNLPIHAITAFRRNYIITGSSKEYINSILLLLLSAKLKPKKGKKVIKATAVRCPITYFCLLGKKRKS